VAALAFAYALTAGGPSTAGMVHLMLPVAFALAMLLVVARRRRG